MPGNKPDAFFLESPSGARFATVTRPVGLLKGGWLFLHPFAEEMNKSRRMVALGARELARNGWLVLQIDFAGCGDSAGDFADAHWRSWLDDISHGWDWLKKECDGPVGIWALRAGCLLAADWLEQNGEQPPLLLWQPVRNGQQHLSQFLRLRTASEMLSADSKGGVAQLRSLLDEGRSVEVAGYELAPALASGLGSSRLELPDRYRGQVSVFELVPENREYPSPGTNALAKELRAANIPVTVTTAYGPSFWQTVEIETAPALIEATICELKKHPQ